MNVERVAAQIAKGGGVYAKALIVGPRQERWLQVLEHVDREEVERAVQDFVRSSTTLDAAARALNVKPDFLFRYKLPACRGGGFRKGYQPPRTKEAALPIVRARVEQTGKGGAGSGAWRIEDLLDDPRSKAAALAALDEVLSACSSIGDVAATLGVTRALVWQWRKRWPELDAIVEAKRGEPSAVGLRKNGRRRLTLEEAIDLIRPHLPGTATAVMEKISEAGSFSGVVPRSRELAFYVGKPDARGLMIARHRMRVGKNVPNVWVLVNTKTGERVDGGAKKGNGDAKKTKKCRGD